MDGVEENITYCSGTYYEIRRKRVETFDGYVLPMLYHFPYLVLEETLRYSDFCYISEEKINDWPTIYVG